MQHPSGNDRQRGVAFVCVVVVLVLAVGLSGALITFINQNSQDSVFHDVDLITEYMAVAALNEAIHEITTDNDVAGDGLGALGPTNPITFFDGDGNAIGEYRTIVTIDADCRQILMAVAAIPNFDDPQAVHSVQAELQSAMEFALLPNPGAMSISGPITNPRFPHMGSNDLLISGGDAPAIALADESSYDNVMEVLSDNYEDGDFTDSEITGVLGETYTQPDGDEFDLPIAQQDTNFLTKDELNDYRVALRDLALDLAADADRTITSTVVGDQSWGTEANPEVVVIEAGTIDADDVFDTRGQTIRGHGTLVVKHKLRPREDLNLEWTGDIFILGYDGDGNDLLYLYGTQGTINGNLILLSSDRTEASLEMKSSSRRGSDLTVNGSVLTLAEAESHESEVEVENGSSLTVNGMLGMYGSRIELEVSSSNASLEVNGSLAMGLPANNTRTDDFEFEMRGDVTIRWDKDEVVNAINGLAGLETDMSFADDETNKVRVDETEQADGIVNPLVVPATVVAVGTSAAKGFKVSLDDFATGTTDYGADVSCMPSGVAVD